MVNKISKLVCVLLCVSMLLCFVPATAEAASCKTITLNVQDGNDIYESMQDALNKARDNATESCPYKIVIPAGNYGLSDTLYIYSNTEISANGAHIYKQFMDGSLIKNRIKSDVDPVPYTASENITIDGGNWDGNTNDSVYRDQESFCNIRIGRCENFKMTNATISNNKGYHHIELGGVRGINITGCTFEGYTQGDKAGGNEAIQLDILHSDQVFPDYEPFDDSLCCDVNISGNSFNNLSRGIGSHTAAYGFYYTNITITNNTFSNLSDQAVFATNFQNSTISGNTMTNVGAGVDFKYMDPDITFNPTEYAPAGKVVSDSKTVISDNIITLKKNSYLNATYGVRISGNEITSDNNTNNINEGLYTVDNVKITGNRVYGNANYGIRLDCTTLSNVTNNYVDLQSDDTSRVSRGISLRQSSNNTISSNICKNGSVDKSNGIQIEFASNGNTFKSNTIYNMAQNGYSMLYAENNTINGGSVIDCGYHGISNSTGCENNTFSSINITGCGNNGISLYYAKNASISGNKISYCGSRGINLSFSTANVYNNIISNSNEYGISVNNESTLYKIYGNLFENNSGDYAIVISSDSKAPIENTKNISLAKNELSNDAKIIGTAQADCTVTAKAAESSIGTSVSSDNGSFIIAAQKPQYSCNILVTAADKYFNRFAESCKYISTSAADYKIGDVNMDNTINLRDEFMLQKFINESAELSEKQVLLADINCDGQITLSDCTMIQNLINE